MIELKRNEQQSGIQPEKQAFRRFCKTVLDPKGTPIFHPSGASLSRLLTRKENPSKSSNSTPN
jgi:hypothetical protein